MGQFTIQHVATGITFHLKANNHEIIATSEVYSGMEACKKGIESVRHNCAAHVEDQTKDGFDTLVNPKYELYTDKAGEFRFRLKARNGEKILASQGYTSKESCKNGIESVAKNAPDAEIVVIEAE